MMQRLAMVLVAPVIAVVLMAAANGAWLKKVPEADRALVNPLAGKPEQIAAGANLYQNNCAQCHGADGMGKASRPPIRSARVTAATDGELFWLMKHGEPFRGMPSWAKLPEAQRWQIVAYLRSIQPENRSSITPSTLPPAIRAGRPAPVVAPTAGCPPTGRDSAGGV